MNLLSLLILPVLFLEGSFIDSQLVNIQSYIPDIIVDLKYATKDNFTGVVVYDFQTCQVLNEVALRLQEVQKALYPIGLKLKIWDGFRPMSAQWKFWELVPDERYVSDPRKGGRHTRGTAVDVTLTTLDGIELPMPTAFDDFSEKAHRNYLGCTEAELKNRELLQTIMEKHGFIGLPTEWWHFDLLDWESYPPIEQNNQ